MNQSEAGSSIFFPNKVQLIINWTFNCPEWILALRNRFKNPFMTLRRSTWLIFAKNGEKIKLEGEEEEGFEIFTESHLHQVQKLRPSQTWLTYQVSEKFFFLSLSLALSNTHAHTLPSTLAQTNTKSYARTSTCWIKLSHTRTQTSLFILALWLLFGWFPFK